MVTGVWSSVLSASRQDSKNKVGLNGHIQFKHGRLPDSRDVLPNGKQSQMYQDLTDRANQVIDRKDDILDHLKNRASGNGDGNGDSLANSNENGYSDERNDYIKRHMMQCGTCLSNMIATGLLVDIRDHWNSEGSFGFRAGMS